MDDAIASQTTDVVVVGAGPAGLAVAACLRRAGFTPVVLERAATVGASWRAHYERLHLHTHRRHSSLPYLPLPRDYPRYPSREQVLSYLETYARAFGIAPRLGEEVRALRRSAGGGWDVATSHTMLRAGAVVLATGLNAEPVRPSWPGLDAFTGPVLHSAEYWNGAAFRDQDVLVVGLGNSGGEIAIDLAEHGARPAISVRSAVNVLPRELLRLPIVTWAMALVRLPPRAADALAAPLLRLAVGDLRRLGLVPAPLGPLASIRARGRIPLIDVGTLALVRAGRVRLRPRVERFTTHGVLFEGGAEEAFGAVVLATGYRHRLAALLDDPALVMDEEGRPRGSGGRPLAPGLYACGFSLVPTGMLREIAREARAIAADLANRGLVPR